MKQYVGWAEIDVKTRGIKCSVNDTVEGMRSKDDRQTEMA